MDTLDFSGDDDDFSSDMGEIFAGMSEEQTDPWEDEE